MKKMIWMKRAALSFALAFGVMAIQGADLYFAGDSTLHSRHETEKPVYSENERCLGSWCDELEHVVKPGVKICNYAYSGRSTKSFIDEGRWTNLLAHVKAGDFVYIQFGHNDQKSHDPTRYAPAEGAYSDNLRRFARDVRGKGARPVFGTPIVRRYFREGAGNVVDDRLEGYPDAVRRVGRELGVPVVDFNEISRRLVESHPRGETLAWYRAAFNHTDMTHLTRLGAKVFCRAFCDEVRARHPALAGLLREGELPRRLLAPLPARTVVTWQFPRTDTCHEGLPFADGVTGVLVWGGDDTLNLTFGRSDLWDHRGGYPWTAAQSYSNIVSLVRANDIATLTSLFKRDAPPNWNPAGVENRYNPYLLPLGRVTLKLASARLERGLLDTATGIGRLVLADGREITLVMSKASHLFALKLPAGLDCDVRMQPATDLPIYEQRLKARGFPPAEKRASGFTWRLPADEPVAVDYQTIDAADGRALAFRTSRGSATTGAQPAAPSFDELVGESTAYWHQFWEEGARVSVPDAAIQEIFDLGMYKFGAMTDADGVAAGLQGPWLEDDRLVPWNGDYHFNINVQECYSPAFRGGHFTHLKPLFRMVLSWRERLRDNARQFVHIDNGYVLPHSVDDRGTCIGGFWTGTIDHASTAWIAALMYRYVRYSGDLAFLKKDAYDFMNGAMNVYLAMLEEHDGRLSLPLGPSPEWGDSDARKAVGRDPSFQLAAIHRLARDLIDAAARLGQSPDPRWLDVERRLPAYTAGEGGLCLFEGQPFVSSHRHHSHMAGFYPFDTIDPHAEKDRAVAASTYRTWVYRGTGEWSGWCLPWAAILHLHFGAADAAAHTLRSWKTFFNNPGHGSLHDAWRAGYTIFDGRVRIMQMDGQCAAVSAVLEMMAHEVNGKTHFFRGCPAEWQDVAFENLVLSDGTRISGSRHNGKVDIRRNSRERGNNGN